MSPGERVRFLDAARLSPVPADQRARILASLPADGEVLRLDAASRRKLEALEPILRAAQRDSVYETKVIDVLLAAGAIHEPMVLLISQVALRRLSAEELQALVAHETGHEYVWAEREEAFATGDVRVRHERHAERDQLPRRHLVGGMLERRRQAKDVHVHDLVCGECDGQRSVSRGSGFGARLARRRAELIPSDVTESSSP